MAQIRIHRTIFKYDPRIDKFCITDKFTPRLKAFFGQIKAGEDLRSYIIGYKTNKDIGKVVKVSINLYFIFIKIVL